jgi:antitoxin component YwqK of YwqJK toxin-antitoxin module
MHKQTYIYIYDLLYKLCETRNAADGNIMSRYITQNGYNWGISWDYFVDGRVTLKDYTPKGNIPVRIDWNANGQRTYMTTKTHIYSWHINGVKELDVPLQNGKNHGLSKRWDQLGNLIEAKRYNNGFAVN